MSKRKNDITQWYTQGFPLAVFIDSTDSHKAFEWRLYDTLDAQMINGKKISKIEKTEIRPMAHKLSDEIWPALTGNQGFFSTKIAYGKEVCRSSRKKNWRNCKKYIFMRDATDATGVSEQLLVSTPTINIVPRWNRDAQHPLILFSQYRESNIALVSVDLKGKKKVVSNFDGVNMQVAFSPEGRQVVYCLSRPPSSQFAQHITSQLYYYSQDSGAQKELFKRLTTNHGNNFAPSWGPENTIFYATDATKNGMPNICWQDLKNNNIAWVTQGCYATSPSFCATNNKLVYTKMVNKKMQICLYDIKTNKHEQLTFDDTNKDDCSWSVCGNLISYSVELDGRNRIGVYNLMTKEQQLITAENEDCTYPSWSPYYV